MQPRSRGDAKTLLEAKPISARIIITNSSHVIPKPSFRPQQQKKWQTVPRCNFTTHLARRPWNANIFFDLRMWRGRLQHFPTHGAAVLDYSGCAVHPLFIDQLAQGSQFQSVKIANHRKVSLWIFWHVVPLFCQLYPCSDCKHGQQTRAL